MVTFCFYRLFRYQFRVSQEFYPVSFNSVNKNVYWNFFDVDIFKSCRFQILMGRMEEGLKNKRFRLPSEESHVWHTKFNYYTIQTRLSEIPGHTSLWNCFIAKSMLDFFDRHKWCPCRCKVLFKNNCLTLYLKYDKGKLYYHPKEQI